VSPALADLQGADDGPVAADGERPHAQGFAGDVYGPRADLAAERPLDGFRVDLGRAGDAAVERQLTRVVEHAREAVLRVRPCGDAALDRRAPVHVLDDVEERLGAALDGVVEVVVEVVPQEEVDSSAEAGQDDGQQQHVPQRQPQADGSQQAHGQPARAEIR
jgi:hypothetical protein